MGFLPKNWLDRPNATTPLNSAGLEDMEARLSLYSDRVAASYEYIGDAQGTITLAPGDRPNMLFFAYQTGAVTFSINTGTWINAGWMELRVQMGATVYARTLPKSNTAGGAALPITATANAVDRYGFSWINGVPNPDGFDLGSNLITVG